jgi:hypothetical protein
LFTVGAKISGLPSGFTYWDNGSDIVGDTTKGVVLVPRFESCAPFGGRLLISSVTGVDNHDGTFAVTVAHAATPVKIDDPVPSAQTFPVDFCGLGVAPILTNKTVVCTDTSHFTITLSASDFGSIQTAAKWIVLYGALPTDPGVTGVAHWYWSDTAGKGNMVLGEWTYDLRTNAEYARMVSGDNPVYDCTGLDCTCTNPASPLPTQNFGFDPSHTTIQDVCKGFVSCAPWLIVLSPNTGDTPPAGTGVRYDFSYLLPLDDRYGSHQAMDAFQGTNDPLCQSPHLACGTDQTPPNCTPPVECRAILPYATAQTVPPDNGAGVGQNEGPPTGGSFVDYTMKNPADYNTGNLADPPETNSQPDSVEVPSGIFPGC